VALAAALTGIAANAGAQRAVPVSQKGRAFVPAEVEIGRGDMLAILNDDGQLLHHVQIDHPRLRLDSGEQEPGQTVTVRFPAPGTYLVQCGIHPRMRLSVTVR
jgi:plastocyanin